MSDLLDVSRIVSGKLALKLRKTALSPLIHESSDVVRPAAESKGVRLLIDVDPEIGSIVADPDRLRQVMWNLLINAVRFTPRGGRITVTADRKDSAIAITVRDTGAGIAPEHLPYVFERFRQADSSTTRAHGGLGLGLAIVRHLVELHGGAVRAESEGLGRGAIFTVTLPVQAVAREADDEATTRATPTDEQPQTVGGAADLTGLRVLAVDDDADSLDLLRVVLESAGAKVTTATSAREALNAFDARGPFDIIVSDIGMPEMDGFGFIGELRSRASGAEVPAIALTAYARVDDAERATQAGYQHHLAKPVDERRLLDVVSKLSQADSPRIHA